VNLLNKIAFFTMILVSCCIGEASATCSSSLPYTFVSTSPLSYVTTNANNNFLLACVTTVDHTQIGTGGIFASQIIPTSGSQATFGGTQTYTFPSNISVPGNAVVGGNSSTTGFVSGHYVDSAYSANQGLYYGGGSNTSQLDYNITNANAWTFTAPLHVTGTLTTTGNAAIGGNATTSGNVAATGYVQGNYINSNYSATQGLFYGGGSNSSQLDYNITNASQWTFTSPLSIQGAVTASGSVQGHYISSNYSTNQGLYYGGGSNTSQLDYNITNSNQWTFTSPLTVDGYLQAVTGSTVSQVMPTLIGGSAVNNQANAHTEVITVSLSSSPQTFNFTRGFDAAPICYGLTKIGPPTIGPYLSSAPTSTQYSVTGDVGGTYSLSCTGT